MFGDGATALVEKGADQLLRQPDRFIRYPHLHALLARLSGEDQKLNGTIADLNFIFSFHNIDPMIFQKRLFEERIL